MFKSFVEYVQFKEEQSDVVKNTANEAIKDLLHLNVGDKLLYQSPYSRESEPIQIINVNLDVVDSNEKRIHEQFKSVKEAADFVDSIPNLKGGTMEVYFNNTPIHLITIYNGQLNRHPEANGLLERIKPMPSEPSEPSEPSDKTPAAVKRYINYGEHKSV